MTKKEWQAVYNDLRKAKDEFVPLQQAYQHGKKSNKAGTLRAASLVMDRAFTLIYKYPQVHELATGGKENLGQASAAIMDDFKNIQYFDFEMGKLLMAIEKQMAAMEAE